MSDFVQSLERGLAVIRAFDADHPEMTLSDVAKVTGLTRAAARRFLHTLVELGYMRTDGKLFALRPKVLDLGYSYLSSLGLPDVAQPHLEKLATEVHESCSVSVLDGTDIVYVARVPTKRIMKVMIETGTRFPAHATSMGRTILAAQDPAWLDSFLATTTLTPLTSRTITDATELRAELTRVSTQGWCVVDEELENGLRSVAAPIRNQGKVVAAVNISTHVSRPVDSVHTDLLPPLLATAEAISADLTASGGTLGR
ncbi:IclR family transcriptional regulator domain-containing protein [Kibdelosporangium phytohabitans]|uniref:Glycerol operon regulatory protein n=1 Tax=Kibdelosporangium phytohabitans TaxID=860235 RepID=A0A0N9I9G9_9PSEU|nr:IclR family transcriptional regulator C-terminal domain-containing protein [Kibdelosporangium phytohabitans]ALG12628.1 IclR family transcriptional regulator [Kibdelosporangium phytohabitans]MBE1464272.1 IclR family pca regulon transcriptional regulator [Kibdelosporangium phytohabitans]